MRESPPIIYAKSSDNPVSCRTVHVAHAFLAGQSRDDLGSRDGGNKGDDGLTPQNLSDPPASGLADIRLDQRGGVKEVRGQLPLPAFLNDDLRGWLSFRLDRGEIRILGSEEGLAAGQGHQAAPYQVIPCTRPALACNAPNS